MAVFSSIFKKKENGLDTNDLAKKAEFESSVEKIADSSDEVQSLEPSWLTTLLHDKHVTDICLNGEKSVFIDRGHGMEEVDLTLIPTNGELTKWILGELEKKGGTWDAKKPYFNLVLATGHRAHVIFPPLSTQGVTISLRRLRDQQTQTRKQGETHWVHSKKSYDFLKNQIRDKKSMIVAGSTGSGKTTLVNDLLEEIDERERIIALEDTSELSPLHKHFFSLLSRPKNSDGYGEVTIRDLLKETLRMRPDRIILGECRGAEVIDLLQALNTGHEGTLATLHANTAEGVIQRLELLASMSSDIPLRAIRGLLAGGIQYVVNVVRKNDKRLISEINEVHRVVDGEIVLKRVIIL